MAPHHVLQEHDFQGLLGICAGEFAFVDKACVLCPKGIDTFRELPDIWEAHLGRVRSVPQFLWLWICPSRNKGEGLLVLQHYVAIINEGLQGLLIITLKPDLQLLPTFLLESAASVLISSAFRKLIAFVWKAFHSSAWFGEEKACFGASQWGLLLMDAIVIVLCVDEGASVVLKSPVAHSELSTVS